MYGRCLDPLGIPVFLFSCLLYLQVPRLARCAKGGAVFKQMLDVYLKERGRTICSKIAMHVESKKGEGASVAERAAVMFEDMSGKGAHTVTGDVFLRWLRNIGIEGLDQEVRTWCGVNKCGLRLMNCDELLLS